MHRRLCRLIAGKNHILPIEVRGLPRRWRLALTFTITLYVISPALEEGTMNEMILAINRRVVVSHEGTRRVMLISINSETFAFFPSSLEEVREERGVRRILCAR